MRVYAEQYGILRNAPTGSSPSAPAKKRQVLLHLAFFDGTGLERALRKHASGMFLGRGKVHWQMTQPCGLMASANRTPARRHRNCDTTITVSSAIFAFVVFSAANNIIVKFQVL